MSWRKSFVRPSDGRVLAGVCAAIADRYGTSRTAVRATFVVSVLLPGPQVLIYLFGWAVFPGERDQGAGPA